jgi:hypothetical protein
VTPRGWEPIQQPEIHVERDRRDRDPGHARPHPHEGAASRDCSVRGIAIARPALRPTRKQSRRSGHDATTGVIEMSPKR